MYLENNACVTELRACCLERMQQRLKRLDFLSAEEGMGRCACMYVNAQHNKLDVFIESSATIPKPTIERFYNNPSKTKAATQKWKPQVLANKKSLQPLHPWQLFPAPCKETNHQTKIEPY